MRQQHRCINDTPPCGKTFGCFLFQASGARWRTVWPKRQPSSLNPKGANARAGRYTIEKGGGDRGGFGARSVEGLLHFWKCIEMRSEGKFSKHCLVSDTAEDEASSWEDGSGFESDTSLDSEFNEESVVDEEEGTTGAASAAPTLVGARTEAGAPTAYGRMCVEMREKAAAVGCTTYVSLNSRATLSVVGWAQRCVYSSISICI